MEDLSNQGKKWVSHFFLCRKKGKKDQFYFHSSNHFLSYFSQNKYLISIFILFLCV